MSVGESDICTSLRGAPVPRAGHELGSSGSGDLSLKFLALPPAPASPPHPQGEAPPAAPPPILAHRPLLHSAPCGPQSSPGLTTRFEPHACAQPSAQPVLWLSARAGWHRLRSADCCLRSGSARRCLLLFSWTWDALSHGGTLSGLCGTRNGRSGRPSVSLMNSYGTGTWYSGVPWYVETLQRDPPPRTT